ncbi:lantibiotic dehydratase [Velocimicrobium porci]|uniref:Subtilin biosynthesis protein SpaB n=1 Tax=Velocimicrobium porci TaxID=2606634 RepID=A0A6L5XW28_9FIRM|nr:lantibiotic dehydratase [Velocimicrobium porci]MSS62727.1 Subtilin biosynthesis protein SpaB [Velocimicrobium porci]
MKKLFNHVNNYMVRMPKEPFEGNIEYTEESMKRACTNPVFREQILVASKSLYDMMNVYLKDSSKLSEKKKKNFYNSMIKYMVRSKTRTTPFGLFSAVTIGKFSEENQLKLVKEAFKKKVLIDLEWLFLLISKIEENQPEALLFRRNEACCIKGNRAVLLYSTQKDVEEISVRATKVFHIVYELCGDFVRYQDIIWEVKQAYPDVEEEKIKNYIAELIKKQILISNLRPPFTVKNQFDDFMERLKQTNGLEELEEKLQQLKLLCEEYETCKIGEGEEKYLEVIAFMKEIISASSYLQIDMEIKESPFKLHHKLANEINELASMLIYISNPVKDSFTYMDEYRNKFMEKYGVNREVPVIELLDSGIGLGAPETYTKPANDFYETFQTKKNYREEWKHYFLDKYVEALENNCPIEITEEEIEKYCDYHVDTSEVPVSLELYFIVKQYQDEMKLYLAPSVGATTAGKTFGRFCDLSNDFIGVLETIYEKEKELREDTVELCELNFLPDSIRSGNVVREVTFREKELSLYTNSNKPKEYNICLQDIVIGIYNEKFYAKNKKNGKFLIFETNNMYNPMLYPNVLRFLQEISQEGKRKWENFPWNYIYAENRYIPEIRFGNIVLSTARWKLHRNEIEMNDKTSYEEFKKNFKQFIIKKQIPEHVYLSESDNRLYLNLAKEYSFYLIYEELKKKNTEDILLEEVEKGFNPLVDEKGNSYVSEIVVPFVKREKEKVYQSYLEEAEMITDEERIKQPFDEWLFLKLYTKQDREEELIAFELYDFYEQIREDYNINCFFMRYADPKPHVRVRFYGATEELIRFYIKVLEWTKELKRKNIISDLVIASYEREIERYGGRKLITNAEHLFFADSQIVSCLLRYKRLGILNYDMERVGIFSIFLYLQQFFDTFEEQLKFLEDNFHSSDYLDEFRKEKEELLQFYDLENDWEGLKKSEEGKQLYELCSLREGVVNAYQVNIKEQVKSKLKIGEIVASVLHLHCNRLFGTDREKERKVMVMAEHIIYAKRYQMKKREHDGKK